MIDYETDTNESDATESHTSYPSFTTDVTIPSYTHARHPWWHDGLAWAASMLAANATALAWAVMFGWITPWAWLMVALFVAAALGALAARVAWAEYEESKDAE